MPWRFLRAIEMTSIALHAARATVTVSIGLISLAALSSPQTNVRPVPVVVAKRFLPSWTSVADRIVVMADRLSFGRTWWGSDRSYSATAQPSEAPVRRYDPPDASARPRPAG